MMTGVKIKTLCSCDGEWKVASKEAFLFICKNVFLLNIRASFPQFQNWTNTAE